MVARVTAGFVLALFCLALPAQADQWSKTYQVTGQADLWMKTGDGNVRIEVWDRAEIEAKLETVGYAINRDFSLLESQSGGRVSIEAKFPSMNWDSRGGHRSLDFVVKVPRDTQLEITTSDGNLTILGVRGQMRLRSGDGQIDASDLDGRLSATSGDGDIRVNGRFDEIDLHAGDGDVEAAAAAGSTVASTWKVTTGDGNVRLRLPDGLKANLEADSGDGQITVDLPVTISGSFSRSHTRGTLNGGGGTVTIHTGDGSIHVGRQ